MSGANAARAAAGPRFKPYPAYKDSGGEWLGEIPAHWEVKRLWHLTPSDRRIMYGIVLPGPNVENGVPIVKGGDVSPERLRLDRLSRTTFEIESGYARSRLRGGDLVYAIRGSIGEVGVVPDELAGANLTQDAARVAYTPATHGPWLLYALKSVTVFAQLEAGALGATISGVNIRDLKRASIPVPPRIEQEAIARFLERETARIDALVANKERLIELLQEKRTALITRAVTKGLDPNVPMKDSGVEWLGEIPAHWEAVRAKHTLLDKIAGPFGSSLTKDSYGGSTYRVYGQEQVIPGDFAVGDYYIPESKFGSMRRFAVQAGDVLLSCVGTFGRAAVVPEGIEPGIINPRLILLRPNRDLVLPEYLELFLKSELSFAQMDEISRGGTMDIINLSMISALSIPLPPKAEQLEILETARRKSSRIDSLLAKVVGAIDSLKELRIALISAAVTGKINVREAAID